MCTGEVAAKEKLGGGELVVAEVSRTYTVEEAAKDKFGGGGVAKIDRTCTKEAAKEELGGEGSGVAEMYRAYTKEAAKETLGCGGRDVAEMYRRMQQRKLQDEAILAEWNSRSAELKSEQQRCRDAIALLEDQ